MIDEKILEKDEGRYKWQVRREVLREKWTGWDAGDIAGAFFLIILGSAAVASFVGIIVLIRLAFSH